MTMTTTAPTTQTPYAPETLNLAPMPVRAPLLTAGQLKAAHYAPLTQFAEPTPGRGDFLPINSPISGNWYVLTLNAGKMHCTCPTKGKCWHIDCYALVYGDLPYLNDTAPVKAEAEAWPVNTKPALVERGAIQETMRPMRSKISTLPQDFDMPVGR